MRNKKVKVMKVFNCNQILIVCILNFYYLVVWQIQGKLFLILI